MELSIFVALIPLVRTFMMFLTFQILKQTRQLSDRVCLCDDGKYQPNCSNNVYSIRAFPGQDFAIRLAVVGAGFAGVVPGSVRAYFGDFSQSASLGPLQSSQASNRPYCMNFNYSVYTTKKNVSLILTSENDFFCCNRWRFRIRCKCNS